MGVGQHTSQAGEPTPLRAVSPLARYARVVTNFIHDLCTGLWAASVIVIWTLSSETSGVNAQATDALLLAQERVFTLLVVALIGIFITGVARLFYWRGDTPHELRGTKRRALVVKHVAFLVVYGAGTLWAARMAHLL